MPDILIIGYGIIEMKPLKRDIALILIIVTDGFDGLVFLGSR